MTTAREALSKHLNSDCVGSVHYHMQLALKLLDAALAEAYAEGAKFTIDEIDNKLKKTTECQALEAVLETAIRHTQSQFCVVLQSMVKRALTEAYQEGYAASEKDHA